MKKYLPFLASLLLSASLLAQAPKQKTLLWKIEGKNLARPSYLYGTMHLMCPDQIKVDTVIKQSFANTKQLFLEIDLDDPQMMAKAMQGMMMKDTFKLQTLVNKTDFDSMNKVFTNYAKVPLSAMAKVKPLLVMSLIFPALLQCTPDGWEKHFQQMAKQNQIPLKGLETIEYQMRVFDTIPYIAQAEMLKGLLYNIDSTKKSITEMINIYLDKDIDGMQAMTVKDPEFGKFESTMLLNRNNNWIPVIMEEIKKVPTFFAVGAAHLGGNNGIINLLRKKGFSVTPVIY